MAVDLRTYINHGFSRSLPAPPGPLTVGRWPDSPIWLAETAGWVMPALHRAGMLKGVKRTKGPAPTPHTEGRARTAAIMVVAVSVVITMVIVAGIHLLRMNGLLAQGAM